MCNKGIEWTLYRIFCTGYFVGGEEIGKGRWKHEIMDALF